MPECEIEQRDGKLVCIYCGYDKFTVIDAHRLCAKAVEKPPGPGSHLAKTLEGVGDLSKALCLGCQSKAAQMNRWGAAGCRCYFWQIVEWLRESADNIGLTELPTSAIVELIRAAIVAAEEEDRSAR